MEVQGHVRQPPPPAPPTLFSDWNFQDEVVIHSDVETKLWKRILFSGASAACAAGAIALKVMNYRHWNANPIGGASLSFLAGGAIQNAVQAALPRKGANAFKSFVADYSVPAFLTLSQVYSNLTDPRHSFMRQPIFSTLTGLGGMCTAAFAHSLFSRRLSEIEELGGLLVEEHKQPTYLKMVGVYGRAARVAWNVGKLALSAGGIFLGTYYPPTLIVRDYSILLAGDAVGQLGHELWMKVLEPMNKRVIEATNANQPHGQVRELAGKVNFYFKFMKVYLVAAFMLPGALIAFSGWIQKARLPAGIAYGGYFTTGLLAGIKRHLEVTRFTNVPLRELRELKRKISPRTTIEKVFFVGKWVFSTIGVLGFIGLGLAGFSFQTLDLQPVGVYDRTALGALLIGLYGAYGAAKLAKRYFKPETRNTSLRNTAYFLTHYSPGIPLLALYIMEKMDIGDKALSRSSTVQGVLGTAAYLSLAWGIGLEVAGRGEFPHPRIFSAISAALIFRFIIEEMSSQV